MRTSLLSTALACLALTGCAAAPGSDVGDDEQALTTRTIINSASNLIAVEGSDCIDGIFGQGMPLTKGGSWTAPTWVNDATVIFNGFTAKYPGGDEHVRVLEAQISQVSFGADHVLRWNFSGNLDDKSGMSWRNVCYHFTVLGWSRANIAARIQTDANGASTDYEGIRTFLGGFGVQQKLTQPPDCPFTTSEPVAILPRGSQHLFSDGLSGPTDHHILRVAHWVSQDQYAGACTQYTTRASLQDNNTDDRTSISSRVSILGGRSVRVQAASDFPIDPRSGSGGCVTLKGGERVEHVHLTGLPFEYAVPMLTGWELAYACDDEHVAQIGASVRNVKYDSCTGTLDYDFVSVLADDDLFPIHDARRDVTILGLNRARTSPLPLPPLCLDRVALP